MVYKKENQTSFAMGAFPTVELLKARPNIVRRIYTHRDIKPSAEVDSILEYASKLQIQVLDGTRIIERVSGKENIYIMAEFDKFSDNIQQGDQIVLHNPSDYGNVGTILRTALGFGVKNIIFIKPCVDVFNPKVIRASMGAIFSLNIVEYESMQEYLNANPSIAKYLFMLDGTQTLQTLKFAKDDKALIFGNEARGLPADFKQYGTPIFIKQSNKIDSLNLAISVAISLYELNKQS